MPPPPSPLPLQQSCNSWMVVKKNPDKKKVTLREATRYRLLRENSFLLNVKRRTFTVKLSKKCAYYYLTIILEFVKVGSYGEQRVNVFGELRYLWRHKYSNSPFTTSKDNFLLRFLINIVTFLLIIF